MTPFGLIDSIFSRPAWGGVANNVRRISPEQLVYLRDLIDADPERGAVKRGAAGSLTWSPGGRHEYLITEDLVGTRHTLTRISHIEAAEMGSLF